MLTGKCLCGAVTYDIVGDPEYVFSCYCATCRRETGSGHATIAAVKEKNVSFNGEMRSWVLPREGDALPITRDFCPKCGTTLAARYAGEPGIVNVRAGTLDGIVDLKIVQAECVGMAQPWDLPPAGIPTGD